MFSTNNPNNPNIQLNQQNIELTDIDKVFCITLDTSLDRQELFKTRFPELVKSNIFEWYITIRDNENPKRGVLLVI